MAIKRTLKNSLAIILFLLMNKAGLSQNFTWMKGTSTLDQNGVYGQIGISTASNNPGSREAAMEWKDANGQFWLFGGYGLSNSGSFGDIINDLWKYDPASNNWTWVKGDSVLGASGVYGTQGTPSSTNKPGSRVDGCSWADGNGNLWLFGGIGTDGSSNVGWLNDLWKYNIGTNQWTWVKGNNAVDLAGVYGTLTVPSNTVFPGSRSGSLTWVDAAGNLWLFGGLGWDGSSGFPGYLNDLWRYNPSTNQWTWMHGSNLADQTGNYGTLNVPSGSNIPGGRWGSPAVVTTGGVTYFLGGEGFDGSSSNGVLNDLWTYNGSTNVFTWIGGSNIVDQTGVYGTLGTPASTNIPGARMGHTAWLDGSNNIWLFGGMAFDASSSFPDQINDLWHYNTSNGQWTWMKGSNTSGQAGTYGTRLIPASTNIPGARFHSSSWIGANNHLYLFGGAGYDPQNYGDFNDLWRFSNCTAPALTITPSSNVTCAGSTLTLTASGAATYTWVNVGSGATATVTPAVNSSYTVVSTGATGCPNGTVYTASVQAIPSITINSSASPLCQGKTATLTANGAANYTWTGVGLGTNPATTVMPVSTTVYSVVGSGAGNCTSTATFSLPVVNNPTVTAGLSQTLICVGQTVQLTALGALNYTWFPSGATSTVITDQPTTQTSYTLLGSDQNGCTATYTAVVKVTACVGIEENGKAKSATLFPNPSTGAFNVELKSDEKGGYLTIYAIAGQQLHVSELHTGQNHIEAKLPAGVYYYTISAGKDSLIHGKLVVE